MSGMSWCGGWIQVTAITARGLFVDDACPSSALWLTVGEAQAGLAQFVVQGFMRYAQGFGEAAHRAVVQASSAAIRLFAELFDLLAQASGWRSAHRPRVILVLSRANSRRRGRNARGACSSRTLPGQPAQQQRALAQFVQGQAVAAAGLVGEVLEQHQRASSLRSRSGDVQRRHIEAGNTSRHGSGPGCGGLAVFLVVAIMRISSGISDCHPGVPRRAPVKGAAT